MAVIDKGYGGQTTEVRVSARDSGTNGELWIEQKDRSNPDMRSETLAYITINEAIELRDELNQAIARMAGLEQN